jgi:sacsin
LQTGTVFVDIPWIDQSFYGDKIKEYKEELKKIGVMCEYREACAFIGNYLMSLGASSTLSRTNVISMLNFIKFLKQNSLSLNHFVSRIREGRWLKTSHGRRSPVGCVLYNESGKLQSKSVKYHSLMKMNMVKKLFLSNQNFSYLVS